VLSNRHPYRDSIPEVLWNQPRLIAANFTPVAKEPIFLSSDEGYLQLTTNKIIQLRSHPRVPDALQDARHFQRSISKYNHEKEGKKRD
jgi:hypothetical protein